MKIIWSPLAIDRVVEISDYIEFDNPEAARKWIDIIFERVSDLKEFPESGRVVPELNKTNIRELVHGNYRIIYRIGKTDIFILTVRHFKQILPKDEVN